MIFDEIHNIYCIGIGGIGVSAAAKYFHARGCLVEGFDATPSELTRELEEMGIMVHYAPDANHITAATQLVVYSPAVPLYHPERACARALGIQELSYPEFLGELSKSHYTIAVTGTNGKSTTTALLALMLIAGGLDPTVFVGSRVNEFPLRNVRLGKSKYLVAEACEYRAHMLLIKPQMIVLTNIAPDHLDYYRDLAHIQSSFLQFINSLPRTGLLAANTDDEPTRALRIDAARAPYRVKWFGMRGAGDYQARNLAHREGNQQFVFRGGVDETPITMRVPGEFNISNMISAGAAAHELGVPLEVIARAAREFKGIWRRFETVAEIEIEKGALPATLISDYGHHPDAIVATVGAARELYPNRRIVLVYQPHQHNRTKQLFQEFVDALQTADMLLLSDIYDVHGREEQTNQQAHSLQLVGALRARTGDSARYIYTGALKETRAALLKNMRAGDVAIIMGAGDIDTVARSFANTKI